MFINQPLKLSKVGYILRCSLISTNSLATSCAATSSIRCLCMTLKILLFNVFDDIDERSQDLTRRITLNVCSAVADPSGTDM